jgi:hypothetical protein
MNVTHNYFNLSRVEASVQLNVAQTVEVVANLIGISDQVEQLQFKLGQTTEPNNDIKRFTTSIYSSNVKELNNSLTGIRIRATDGRLYTDEYIIPVDVQKPDRPVVSFRDGAGNLQSTLVYITQPTDDGTVKYRVYNKRIDDTDGDSDNPSTMVAEIPAAEANAGSDAVCKSSLFANSFDYATLVTVALDNELTAQANFSDMTKVNYVPMQNVSVLESISDTVYDAIYYSPECVRDNTKDGDGGVGVKALNGSVRLAYRPIDISTSTDIPLTIYVATGDYENNTTIAKVTYRTQSVGKRFFIYHNGYVYGGTFLDSDTSKQHDSDNNPYELEFISKDFQTLGNNEDFGQ